MNLIIAIIKIRVAMVVIIMNNSNNDASLFGIEK